MPGESLDFGEPTGLKYGGNWHDKGVVRRLSGYGGPDVAGAEVLYGSKLGFNNYLDIDGGVGVLQELRRVGYANSVIVAKHGDVCGAATGKYAAERAFQGDPKNAFGGIWGFGVEFTADDAAVLCDRPNGIGTGWQKDVIFSPVVDSEALEYMEVHETQKMKPRVVKIPGWEIHESLTERVLIRGGIVESERYLPLWLSPPEGEFEDLLNDTYDVDGPDGKTRTVGVVTEGTVDVELADLMKFGLAVCRQEKSNSTIIVRKYGENYDDFQLLGYGTGQKGRVDSCEHAVQKAYNVLETEWGIINRSGSELERGILTSDEVHRLRRETLEIESLEEYRAEEMGYAVAITDSFFPFPDGLERLAEGGVKTVVYPGGSVRNRQVIAKANELGVNLVFTGVRLFKHGETPT